MTRSLYCFFRMKSSSRVKNFFPVAMNLNHINPAKIKDQDDFIPYL